MTNCIWVLTSKANAALILCKAFPFKFYLHAQYGIYAKRDLSVNTTKVEIIDMDAESQLDLFVILQLSPGSDSDVLLE